MPKSAAAGQRCLYNDALHRRRDAAAAHHHHRIDHPIANLVSLSLFLSFYLCNWPISDVHFIISIFSSLLPVCRAEGVEAGRPYGQCECLESLLPSGGVGGGGGQLLETNWSEWSEEVAGEEEDTHFNSSPLYFYFSLSQTCQSP